MEAQVGTAQQLPLDQFAGLEVQRGRQRDGEVDEEARGLTFGADRLNPQHVFVPWKVWTILTILLAQVYANQ